MNIAIEEARNFDARIAVVEGLKKSILIATVEDGVTGTGGMARRIQFGIMQDGDEFIVQQDWELVEFLNGLWPRKPTSAKYSGDILKAAESHATRLLDGLRKNMPRTTSIFVRPTARGEMLLLPGLSVEVMT